ncbi:MAG TPA: ABC-F family ATP-binding cassette domain-containing protein [Solirubrobacteraceae bacterium]|nr:ABC-F family ATP-binding cassette domain-containing protein [Solirubrobacteraceae bacterium]
MSVIIASDISKDISGEPLLRGVSFKLERRDRMSLSGRNGAGKTTLLRMISGEASIDGGELVLAKGAKIALHDQRPPRDQQMTLRDYVLSGAPELIKLEDELQRLEQRMAEGDYEEATLSAYADAQAALEHAGGYTWREQALSTLHGLGFNDDSVLDRRLETFSGGELTRASLGRALAGRPDLLLLDEPTNHLDIESLEWLETHLNALDAAVILIAHDRWFLESVATAVLELEAGRGKFFPGTWHQWRTEKAQRELALGRAIERQQAEIERLEKFVTRFRAGTRARQAQARQKRLDKIERIERGERDREGLAFAFKPPERSGRVVFELQDGSVQIGERTLLSGGDLWLERGEHVSVVGPNGAGKTTLIETLAGYRPFADDGADARDHTGMAIKGAQKTAGAGEGPVVTGKLLTGHNVKIGFLSQHSEDLHAGNARTVVEACTHLTKLTPANARALLGRFLFSGEEAEKPLDGLSGGERQRLSLAILVQSGANVLILDEPTNHLDVESREALEDALSQFTGSLLLISHDRALLDAVGSRTVAFEDGTLHTYLGGWAEYIRVREERAEQAAAAKQAAAKSKPRPAAKPAAGRNSNDGGSGKQQAKLEQQIEQAEAALRAIEEELADPSAWETPARSADSSARHEAAKRTVDGLYARYEQVAG